MAQKFFQSGAFRGVPVTDAFAAAALRQEPVVVEIGSIPWPQGLAPAPAALGKYSAGEKITGPLNVQADALVVLYTEEETSALLDVFTQNNQWNAARQKTWSGYAHNFAKFQSTIEHIGGGGVRCMLAEIHLPKRGAARPRGTLDKAPES